MASNPDIIQPQSPPELPGIAPPAETPAPDLPEIEPLAPDTDVPDPHLPETPPPPD